MRNWSASQLVIVTGGAGFIGSQLALGLLKSGLPREKLLLVDDPEAFLKRPCCKELREKAIDVLAPESFLGQLENFSNVEALYHMGASSSTEEMREDFLKRVNIDYSKSLWTHCSQAGIPFFYASSAATYGDGSLGFDDDPALFSKLKPLNPYGRSKLAFDCFVLEELAHNRHPPRWAGFRFFNVYGPGEEHKGSQASVIWAARKQLLESGKIRLFQSHHPDYKDGEQKRDFVWVGDLVRTLLAFGQNSYQSGVYNLGTGQARTFIDLARAVGKALHQAPQIEFIPTPEKLRSHYQYFTEARLERLQKSGFDFHPTPLEEGVAFSLKSTKT